MRGSAYIPASVALSIGADPKRPVDSRQIEELKETTAAPPGAPLRAGPLLPPVAHAGRSRGRTRDGRMDRGGLAGCVGVVLHYR